VLEVAEAQDPVVEFNSLSKSHNMAGWRLGVLVGNRGILEKLYTLKTHADSGHFHPIQQAGVVALQIDNAWVKARNKQYQRRRDLVVSVLETMGVDFVIPRGAIYLWFPVPPGFESMEFARRLLEQNRVALTPGIIFGSRGEGYLRLSLTSPEDQLREGLDRLRKGYADAL
jgi:LL-diaminopimelate aminotransferase